MRLIKILYFENKIKCKSDSECLENAFEDLQKNMLTVFQNFYKNSTKLSK